MFAELQKIVCPECYKNYKRFSCYMPDQPILLYLIAVIMSELNFKTQNELVSTCLENKKKYIDRNITKITNRRFQAAEEEM
jgi:hypothetical protein